VHLEELDLAADVRQRPHLDPRLVQVDEEVGDAFVLGQIHVGPGQQHGEVGAVGPGRPYLLPADHPPVAVTFGRSTARRGRYPRQAR